MIHAIDPGLANTAIVSWEPSRIVSVVTVRTDGSGHKTDPAAALVRCSDIAYEVLDIITSGDIVVMESYIDIPGMTYRNAANRWTTPMLIGYLAHAVETRGCTIVLQRPDVVMKQYKAHMAAWAAGTTGLTRGDELLGHPECRRRRGNEHERSAAAHLAYYLDHTRGDAS